MMTSLREDIETLLDEIIDPCSAGMGMPIGLVSMGLIKELKIIDAGLETKKIELLFRLTSPCCMMAPHFAMEAKSKLEKIDQISEVDIKVCPKIDWEPAHMKPEVRDSLPRPEFLTPF